MQTIRLWEVTSQNTLKEIEGDGISLESHLENWLESDFSMLDPNLLVIGRQVPTAHGGIIDLLCIDRVGALVVVELKKGKTPREVATQALDYASWVKDLGAEEIKSIAQKHGKLEGSLKDAFEARFEIALPDVLNESHRAVVVAESIRPDTERIVRYLAELGVPINVATVQHFRDESGREILAQVYLVDPELAATKDRSRRRSWNLGDLQELAEKSGIGDLFAEMRDDLRGGFRRGVFRASAYRESVGYSFPMGVGHRTLFFIWAVPHDDEVGMPVLVHVNRFADFGMTEEQLRNALPGDVEQTTDVRKWVGSSPDEKTSALGLTAVFRTIDEVDKFTTALREVAGHHGN